MLFSLEGDQIAEIPRARQAFFDAVLLELGQDRVEEVRSEFNRLIDNLQPERNGLRAFRTTFVGSSLTPWQGPLAHLYDAAARMFVDAAQEEIEEQSGFMFGLFAWECFIVRADHWVVYDPNLRGDPNRDILGKEYFERQ